MRKCIDVSVFRRIFAIILLLAVYTPASAFYFDFREDDIYDGENLSLDYFSEKFGHSPWFEIPLYMKIRSPSMGGYTETIIIEGVSEKESFFENHPVYRHAQNHIGIWDPDKNTLDRYQFHVPDYRKSEVFEEYCIKKSESLCHLFRHFHLGYADYRELKEKGKLSSSYVDDMIRRNQFRSDWTITRLKSTKWLIEGLPAYINSNPGPLFEIENLLNRIDSGQNCEDMGHTDCLEVVSYRLRLNLAIFKEGLLDPKGIEAVGVDQATAFSAEMSRLVDATKALKIALSDSSLRKEVYTLAHILLKSPGDLGAWRQVLTTQSVLLSGQANDVIEDLLIVINSVAIIDQAYSYLLAISIKHPLVRLLNRLFSDPDANCEDLLGVLVHNSRQISKHADFILTQRKSASSNCSPRRSPGQGRVVMKIPSKS